MCHHHFHITRDFQNHQIGECIACHTEVDFTERLERDPGWRKIFKENQSPILAFRKPIGITTSQVLF